LSRQSPGADDWRSDWSRRIDDELHFGILGLYRETRNAIDLRSDVIKDARGVIDEAEQLEDDVGRALGRDRRHLFDALDRPHGLFDFLADALFDFLRSCSGIRNRDDDHVEIELRKRFPPHRSKRQTANEQQCQKRDIQGRGISN
jgi:hypothetical protein